MLCYEPPVWNRANTLVPLLLYVGALVAFLGTPLVEIPLLLQLPGTAMLVVAIMLIARYSLSSRCYLLSAATAEQPGVLTVEQVQGTRCRTLCELPLTEVAEVVPHQKKKAFRTAHGKVSAYQDARRNLTPALCYDLICKTEDTVSVLVLECSEEFAAELSRRIQQEKTATADKNEGETE